MPFCTFVRVEVQFTLCVHNSLIVRMSIQCCGSGSGTFCRIQIRNRNKSFRIRIHNPATPWKNKYDMSSTSFSVSLPRQEYPYLQNKQSKEEAAKNSLVKNIQGTVRPRNDLKKRYIDNGGGRVKRRMVRLAR